MTDKKEREKNNKERELLDTLDAMLQLLRNAGYSHRVLCYDSNKKLYDCRACPCPLGMFSRTMWRHWSN